MQTVIHTQNKFNIVEKNTLSQENKLLVKKMINIVSRTKPINPL